jgi:ABC-type dipeptide/oligopeptide/nickel transport system permease component
VIILYVIRRILLLIPILLGVTVATFMLTRVIPGDPIARLVDPLSPPSVKQALIRQYGLNEPLPLQYLRYIDRLLHLDLGTSFTTLHPVASDLASRFQATFELTSYAMLLALTLGLTLGIVAAVWKNSIVDHAARLLSVTGVGMPAFWVGLVLIYLFFYLSHVIAAPSGRLDPTISPPTQITGFFTIDSLLTGNWSVFGNAVHHLIAPVVVLAFPAMAPIARITRSSMIEVLDSDYTRTARALGIGERLVVLKYGLKNALLPVITYAGVIYGFLLGGSVLVEFIFSWPGMGLYAYNAITGLDYPAVQGFILYATVVYVSIFLVLDIVYLALDPRIKYG